MQTTKNTTKKDPQSIPVATRITKPMYKAILLLLNVDAHLNLADYLRDLIRNDLKGKGIVFELEKKGANKS